MALRVCEECEELFYGVARDFLCQDCNPGVPISVKTKPVLGVSVKTNDAEYVHRQKSKARRAFRTNKERERERSVSTT